jgi:hypothetical protein
MKMQEIREIAQSMEIPAGRMKKSDLVRVIQRKEGNLECFDEGQSTQCGQDKCLWIGDCK